MMGFVLESCKRRTIFYCILRKYHKIKINNPLTNSQLNPACAR
ncbi:MAG: hypothetical protein KIPDCIKN_04321 [Haliscomenobacter sp.]|jgi:hypothetical protein|nr:hypothetical protein [Haliscomenobacter sp.]